MGVKRLIKGFGVNDANYPVLKIVDGVRIRCPYYQTWVRMIDRCYSKIVHLDHPTYSKCTIDKTWSKFSVFKSWMEKQDWEGKQLDKDVLVSGNNVYGPDTCLFVSRAVNMFMVDREDSLRELPHGVKLTVDGTYSAQLKVGGKSEHIGTFKNSAEASDAYRKRKQEVAMILANEQTDYRVKNAIMVKFGGAHWTEVVESKL